MKAIVFDAGTLINLSMNGLLYLLADLKKAFKGNFLITDQVKYEVIDRPLKIKRFQLGAMRVKNLYEEGILESPTVLGIKPKDIKKQTKELMQIANNAVFARKKPIRVVSEGETSCLALSSLLKQKKVENMIAVDERTIRILSEKPENLQTIMERKLHHEVEMSQPNFEAFKGFKFIRSSELVYIAFKKGFLELDGRESLEAALYATKFKGAAISYDEIEILKKM